MVVVPKNMSVNLASRVVEMDETAWSGHGLRLNFFEAGSFRRPVKGWVHAKTLPYTVLAQAVEGAYELRRAGGARRKIGPGRVLVVPAHVAAEFTHRDGASGWFEARWLHLRYVWRDGTDFLRRYDLPWELPERESQEFGEWVKRVLAVAGMPADAPERLVCEQEAAGRVLGLLCGASKLHGEDEGAAGMHAGVALVLARVRANPAAMVDGASLAKTAGLSPARFYALFKQELGVTPMDFVRTVRLEEAARLLVATNAKLVRVAEATGFADAFHLSHAFKARFGVSPRDYRGNAARVHP